MNCKPYHTALATALILLLTTSGAFAGDLATADTRGQSHEIRIYLDNDFNFSDDYYTSGVKAEYRTFGLPYQTGRSMGQQAREIGNIGLMQEMYTPKNLTPTTIVRGDRPYAGWLYLSLIAEELRSEDDSSQKYGVDLGCIGPCSAAEQAQDAAHAFASYIRPGGWKYQIAQEYGLVLHYDKRFSKLVDHRFKAGDGIVLDLAPRFHLEAGNIFDRGSVGFQMRLGKAAPYFDAPHNPRGPNGTSADPTEFYILVSADGMGVAYNATMQGGMYNKTSPYTTTPSKFVLNGETGAVLDWREFSAYVGLGFTGSEMASEPLILVDHVFWRFQLAYRY